jgi:DNA-binding NarL/FixJ family response regulator
MKAKNKMRSMPLIRVAVVDGDPIRFVGFCSFLADESDIEPIAVSSADLCSNSDIDVILLWNQLESDTLNALHRFKALNISVPAILTGKQMSDIGMVQALELGARGCVDETAPATDFSRAIRAVRKGSIWVSRRILSVFVQQRHSDGPRNVGFCNQSLTARELEVLKMLVAGRSNKEIGVPLGIEERTVKAHVARLMRKVGAKNRIMLSVQAIERSLVTL